MKITFDPAKRADTLRRRRIDFLDAERVFAGFDVYDRRLSVSVSGGAVHHRGTSVGAHGDRGLDADRGRPPYYFDEKG